MDARSRILCALIVLVLVLGVPAFADDEGLLLPDETVSTSLAAGESRTVAFAGLRGGRWTVSVRTRDDPPVLPQIALLSPAGTTVDPGRRLRISRRTASVRDLPLDATGTWRAVVTAPPDGPAEVEISVRGRAPRSVRWSGVTSGDPASDAIELPALPGAVLDLRVRFQGRPRPTTDLAVHAPGDGAEIAAVRGKPGHARLSGAVVPAVGDYEVRVGGGPARYRCQARIRPPAPRATVAFEDVEALPEITGLSPATLPNDAVRALTLTGFALSSRHRVRVGRGGAPEAFGPFLDVTPSSARAELDLEGVAAGTLEVAVALPSGRSVVLPLTLEVTNLPPAVDASSPAIAWTAAGTRLRIDGEGFDADAHVALRRVSDDLVLTATVATWISHRLLLADLPPAPHSAGLYDVFVVDPDGTPSPTPTTLELLGERAAPALLRTFSTPEKFALALAADEQRGTILYAVSDPSQFLFEFADRATGAVVSRITVPEEEFPTVRPSAEFHAVDDTWGMSWVYELPDGVHNGFVRIVRRTDVENVVLYAEPAFGEKLGRLVLVPARTGGWRLLWWAAFTAPERSLLLLEIAADGSFPSPLPTTLETDPLGLLDDVSAAQRPDGAFVVTCVAPSEEGSATPSTRSIVRRVVASDGTEPQARRVCADETAFPGLSSPQLAAHPTDGSVLLGFTWDDGGTPRIATVLLASGDAAPVSASFRNGRTGTLTSLRWHADRGEYVGAVATSAARVALVRFGPDGTPRPDPAGQVLEGRTGFLHGGGTPGSLGLLRVSDGSDDGAWDITKTDYPLLDVPLR